MFRRWLKWLRRKRRHIRPVARPKWESASPATRVFRVEAPGTISPVCVLGCKRIPKPGDPWKPGSQFVCVSVHAIPLKRSLWEVVCRYEEAKT